MYDSESLIQYGGLLLLFLSVYCQTGLFFCFFIPSGGLIFTGGVYVATGQLPMNLLTLCSLLIIASVLGNITGYALGFKVGSAIYKWKDSRSYKRKYLNKAESFNRKYKKPALVLALFLPVTRTFSPILAGVIRLDFRGFVLYTFIGSVLLISGFVSAGYLVGIIPGLQPYLKYIVIGIILVVTSSILIGISRRFRDQREEETLGK